MPERAEGEKPTRLWQAIFWFILLVLCAALMPGISRIPISPTTQPTSIVTPSNSTPTISTPTVANPTWPADFPVQVVNVGGDYIGPLSDVVVRVSDSQHVDSGADGKLQIPSCSPSQFLFAWAPGYEINEITCNQMTVPRISLNPLQAVDNMDYSWLSAENDCGNCHGSQFIANAITFASYDEINEWKLSGHAKVFRRDYFESMYRGTTLDGKLGQPVTPVIIGNDWVPVPPEKNSDYHGPGYKLDFPEQPGNCALCHAPAAIRGSPVSVH
ncbi:MAG: hypothetical protein M3Y68_11840, partial [Chloroflexota bacterium]|nr:hypothetical protein [Chloroflexota bacterium]